MNQICKATHFHVGYVQLAASASTGRLNKLKVFLSIELMIKVAFKKSESESEKISISRAQTKRNCHFVSRPQRRTLSVITERLLIVLLLDAGKLFNAKMLLFSPTKLTQKATRVEMKSAFCLKIHQRINLPSGISALDDFLRRQRIKNFSNLLKWFLPRERIREPWWCWLTHKQNN